MSTPPFFAADEATWEAACSDIPKPWPEAFALLDLRYHENRADPKVAKAPFPGRQALAKRWGWTGPGQDERIRKILKVGEWHDPNKGLSYADLQATRRVDHRNLSPKAPPRSPQGGPKEAPRQERANAEKFHESTKEPPRLPQGAPKAPPYARGSSRTTINHSTTGTTQEARETRPAADAAPPVDVPALWSRLVAFTPKPSAWKLTTARQKHLLARVADFDVATVERVAEWVRLSNHERARFLRDRGDVDTLLRPEKFAAYAAMSAAPEPRAGAPPGLSRPARGRLLHELFEEAEAAEPEPLRHPNAIDAPFEVVT